MHHRRLVPGEFVVPARLEGADYHLRMLSIHDLVKDYDAVISSRDRLKGLFGPEGDWPDGLTLEEDLIDLAWHQREFTLRYSFAYTVVSTDETRCMGCFYLFPSQVQGFDAAAFYWVRSGPDAEIRDGELGARLRQWLKSTWPFRSVAFPGRDIAWSEWRRLQSAECGGRGQL